MNQCSNSECQICAIYNQCSQVYSSALLTQKVGERDPLVFVDAAIASIREKHTHHGQIFSRQPGGLGELRVSQQSRRRHNRIEGYLRAGLQAFARQTFAHSIREVLGQAEQTTHIGHAANPGIGVRVHEADMRAIARIVEPLYFALGLAILLGIDAAEVTRSRAKNPQP